MVQNTALVVDTISLAEFVRMFNLRGKNIAWFTGAGASVAAGLPSAYDMVWDFKLTIFCSEQRLPISQYTNLNSSLKSKIQSYFDGQAGQADGPPKLDSLEEYSYYFKRAYNSQSLRSDYIEGKLSDAKPTYGYKSIGALMKMGYINYILTTNFDRLIEDAAALAFGSTSKLHVASIDNNYRGLQFIQDHKVPALLKLHGDFHSLFMKNTSNELHEQDENLRSAFLNICQNYGLAFIGYSGRDDSIINVLEETLGKDSAFPNGLYWFIRPGNRPINRVMELLSQAKAKGIETYLIEIDSFEECLSSIIKSIPKITEDISSFLHASNKRIEKHPIPNIGRNYPVLRLNALHVQDFPGIARLIECQIGGHKDVALAVSNAKANVICTRKKQGIIGFGDDAEFDRAFPNNKKSIYNIEEKFLGYDDSPIKNIVTESMLAALTRDRPLRWFKKGGNYFIVLNPKEIDHDDLKPLSRLEYMSYNKNVKHRTNGYIPGTNLLWVDALQVNIVRKYASVFLIIDPSIRVAKSNNDTQKKLIAPFVKEELAKRLNGPYNSILDAWIKVLFGDNNVSKTKTFETFASINGINPQFTISQITSFSRSL
ncbi:SIR2 family protein [Parapedobacter defluvii]|uniref:SIR2 family protein n=1 Tax=Parapedobacter defluvii TaxID=2045106 RepID=UPI003342C412